MAIHNVGYTFLPSPDALSRVGLSQRERRLNEPLSLWERGRGEGYALLIVSHCCKAQQENGRPT